MTTRDVVFTAAWLATAATLRRVGVSLVVLAIAGALTFAIAGVPSWRPAARRRTARRLRDDGTRDVLRQCARGHAIGAHADEDRSSENG